ncbi:MAG: hypothetical protein QOI64_1035 [Solirubrobacteraceae bacterium]|nr:hypothetical protein [Solirubrobacteraceae bacterium]
MENTLQPIRDAGRPWGPLDGNVAAVMTPGIITCAPETSLARVAEIMATHRVHALAVGGVADDHLVWGVIDALGLVRALRTPAAHPTARSISRRPASSIEPEAPLAEAARLMDEGGVGHLVVVDRERPVGVISTLDVACAAAGIRT